MVVESGQAPYQYVGSKLRFSALGQNIAPSAILYEEAMFALKAEYNRVRTQSSGFNATNREITGADYDPENPEASFKFVNSSGSFIKYVNVGLSGIFDPNPSGGYLDGRLTPVSGTASGMENLPGAWHSRDYITDMQDVMVSVHTRIADYIDDDADVSPSDVYRSWFTSYKGYKDGWAESGLFYEESGVLDELNGDFWDDIRFNTSRANIGVTSGIFDRHLDEVRIQPMPYILGQSGSLTSLGAGGAAPWEDGVSNLNPTKPRYFRTDGTVASGWDNIKVYGDVLVSGMDIVLSGLNGDTHVTQSWVAETDDFFPNFPRSGAFTPPAMSAGWYKMILSASGTDNDLDVLFPWGTGTDDASLIAQWPRQTRWYGEGGNRGFIVNNTIQGLQDHEPNAARTSFSPPDTESGLFWYGLSPSGVEDGPADAQIVDLVPVRPFTSGVGDGVWGHDLRTKWGNGTGTKVRSGGWIYDRSNDQIVRTMSSGGHDVWLTAAAQTDYIFGSGVINVFEPRTIDLQSVNLVGTAGGAGGETFRAYGLSAITFDGTDYIVNGFLNHDPPSGTQSQSGAYLKINTSFNLVDAVLYTASSGSFRLHWARDTDEFLGVSNALSTSMPGVGSGGYFVVDLTFGAITSAGGGSYTVLRHTMQLASGVSGLLNLDGVGPRDRTPRIIDFFDAEDGSNTLHCMFWGYAAGTASGAGNTWRRWIGEVDTAGGHPYEITEAWQVGLDSTRNSINSNVQNAEFSMYMDNWEY